MIKFRSYEYKKVYLDQKIFKVDQNEIKTGYLNINGLQDGKHDEYLNEDKNLNDLDFLVLSETKLVNEYEDKTIRSKLYNWTMIARYDSEDKRKHMGLLILKSKSSKFNGKLRNCN